MQIFQTISLTVNSFVAMGFFFEKWIAAFVVVTTLVLAYVLPLKPFQRLFAKQNVIMACNEIILVAIQMYLNILCYWMFVTNH